MLCKNCGFMHNTNDTAFCVACGEELASSRVPAMAAASAEGAVPRVGFMENEPPLAPEAAARADERPGPVSHESLLAKLDRVEQDIFSRLDEKLPVYTPEPDPDVEDLDTKDDSLSSLSLTLDSLISDLLNAEMNEYMTSNLLRPDEAGFPSPSRDRRAPLPQKQTLGHRMIDASFVVALVAAIFLLGMTVGLWSYYVLGF